LTALLKSVVQCKNTEALPAN